MSDFASEAVGSISASATKFEVTMAKVLSEFIPVTEHYGYRLEVRYGSPMCVIYRADRIHLNGAITGRYSKQLAIKECHYIESLNFGKD